MITKDSVFAQAGAQDTSKTKADFRTGMIPKTIAMAEDVNTYGNMSDKDLKVVCDELVNALQGQDIAPNNSYAPGSSNQLDTMIKSKLKSGFILTGLDYSTYDTPPAQTGNTITFPEMKVTFNSTVYYGNTQATVSTVTIPAQTINATNDWNDGAWYIYANTNGTLGHQAEPVNASDGDTKCYLGSVFVIGGQFQANSWRFTPWLQMTAPTVRESPQASRKGGYLTPIGGLKLGIGTVQIMNEGINFGTNPKAPSIITFPAHDTETDPFTYKYMYPTYDPNTADTAEIDTTHLYNMTTGTWDDVSALAGKYICIVPCIVPSGQTLMVPAMSYKPADTYTSVFNTVEDARNAIFGLQYQRNRIMPDGTQGADVLSRCIYLGQTLIVKIGADDLTNPDNFSNVGQVPQALGSFTDASGQTGGGAGAYIPMPEVTHNNHFTANVNAASVVIGSTQNPIQVGLPQIRNGIVNQVEIKYKHETGMQGLAFPVNVIWWGSAPTWIAGAYYNIIFENFDGQWIGGYLNTIVTE